jgi:ABC-type sugar transport system ATPase subunit
MRTPLDARGLGIETVYQTLAVSPALDIADNRSRTSHSRSNHFQEANVKALRSREQPHSPSG